MVGTTWLIWDIGAYFTGHGFRKVEIDVVEYFNVSIVDNRFVAVAQFE